MPEDQKTKLTDSHAEELSSDVLLSLDFIKHIEHRVDFFYQKSLNPHPWKGGTIEEAKNDSLARMQEAQTIMNVYHDFVAGKGDEWVKRTEAGIPLG